MVPLWLVFEYKLLRDNLHFTSIGSLIQPTFIRVVRHIQCNILDGIFKSLCAELPITSDLPCGEDIRNEVDVGFDGRIDGHLKPS